MLLFNCINMGSDTTTEIFEKLPAIKPKLAAEYHLNKILVKPITSNFRNFYYINFTS